MDKIATMLQTFSQLPKHSEDPITFLEIAGYPHLENVASNILAFYFQSSNPHPFGNLVFRALMALVNQNVLGDYSVRARREDVTLGNKRIDLVIDTDEFIIGIENKIYHHLHNDLNMYNKHLESLANGRTIYGFVLALHPITLPAESNFKSITYTQLLAMVQSLYEPHHYLDSNKYTIFFQDFSQTMLHLSRGTSMSLEQLAFFQSNHQQIQDLLNEVKNLRDDMQKKLNQLAEIIQNHTKPNDLKPSYWSPDRELFEILNYTLILDSKSRLQIDIILNLQGWNMQFFNRRGDKSAIQMWIDQRQIPYELHTKPLWRLRLAQAEVLPYTADLELVAEWAVSFIQRLRP